MCRNVAGSIVGRKRAGKTVLGLLGVVGVLLNVIVNLGKSS